MNKIELDCAKCNGKMRINRFTCTRVFDHRKGHWYQAICPVRSCKHLMELPITIFDTQQESVDAG